MEPPRGVLASLWKFICFLPYFIALLILGLIKGVILCPLTCLTIAVGNFAVILGLWLVHFFYTYYCILSSKQLGPVLKFVLCQLVFVLLICWPAIGVFCSIAGGVLYGLFAPMIATFQAVGEGKTNQFYHCIHDGILDTVKGSFTVVRDFTDVCYHSYFSLMNDSLLQGPSGGKYYEFRFLYLPGALVAGMLGLMVDMTMITIIASYKSPYMLFKGWHRLFHDCIGREGPFLETICVPFAGLAILLWPLVVAGAVLGSMMSSIFLGAYAAVVVYQESSFWLGLCYVAASLSIYDEYSNDVLDMPEGSCFPRPRYRKKAASVTSSRAASFSRPQSFKIPPSRTSSFTAPMLDIKPLELVDALFKECQLQGEIMVSEGIITLKDIEDAKSNKDCDKIISIGLPAYCIFKALLRSAKANSAGILINDNITEITATNRPKDAIFDWFLNPLLIIKEQIIADNLSEAEEEYLGKLVLLSGDPEKVKKSDIGSPPESELRRAELDALARRLQGITRSISRYPTFRRRFDSSMNIILQELAKKNGGSNIIAGGVLYGLFAPMIATFQAVGEGKTNQFYHCIHDGILDTVKGSFTVVRDFTDVCYHSYFSLMNDSLLQGPSGGKYYEFRFLYLPGALVAGMLGLMVDMTMITIIASYKSPYMLFKGWHRLFHDCIGREGPFLETICVPFAGLAILLWPLVVAGAVLGSMMSSIFLGAYAAVVVYQESSFWLGLCYVAASLSIYDEYSNDVLDMPEGSCFPRPRYRKKAASVTSSRAASFSRPQSFKIPPSRTSSFTAPMLDIKPLELVDALFKECQLQGEIMVSEGIITLKDIEDAKSNKDCDKIISIGLPAYCIFKALLRSAKANSAGILINDNITEITATNRPKDAIFDWFLNPLLIIKEQIIADNLSEAEEEYLGKLVLLSGDPEKVKKSDIGSPPESELRRAELDALARRLQGITRSISRYPTFRRRFDSSMNIILQELAKKNGGSNIIAGGVLYGLFAPMIATFQAVGEGKTNQFYHCIHDGILDTVKGSFTVVRDFTDVCYHSYFSLMNDSLLQGPSGGKYYEFRFLYLPGALVAGMLGLMVDMTMITIIASYKSPYMLFKGWHRLFHDCIGREGPFLETICVPFAGLAILLWPLVVAGAVLGSMMSSIFLGAYAAVVVYQESSFWLGLCYVAASLSIYDEYSNDVLDMPEGSCFPRPRYRKKAASVTSSRAASFSRPQSFKIPPSRTSSFTAPMLDIKPLELVDALFKECQLQGEIMVSEGIITLKDIEDAKSNKDCDKIISIGLPAYCIFKALLRSAKANSAGILINDNITEITATNRPKDAIFDWFLNPLLIIKEQIIADNLSEAEEEYLGKLVLLSGDPEKVKKSDIGSPPESELRRAELDALARRLQGITRSISRYPTFRRRFDSSMNIILQELAKKNGGSNIIAGGVLYGLFAPMIATFQAVGEGKTNQFYHCIHDGILDTVKGSFTVVRDFTDVCYHSYFSLMNDSLLQGPSGGKYYEFRFLYLPGALVAGMLGLMVDMTMITIIASYKSPYMLFKGWHRLFHDCIGREGPFLETICVPFAGLAILLWPLVVAGAVLGSMMSSIFLGAYAAVVVYQESSFWLGLCYVAASLSIYDEYSNDVLDMPEGSCFPRPRYRKKAASVTSSRAASFSRPQSFKIPPSRTSSFTAPMLDIKPLELVDALFKECQLQGEIMVSEGIITLKDIEDAKSNKDCDKIISIGLPAYCIFKALLRSAKANSAGILINDNITEITATNRPKDAIFDWFLNPLLIIKEQIIADNLSEAEEEYLGKLVLLSGDPEKVKKSDIGSPPESELRRAELDALARRLQGITRSISRYPTFRRRFDSSMNIILQELAKKNGGSNIIAGRRTVPRSRSMFARMLSQKSFKTRTSNNGSDQEAQPVVERDVEII